MRLTDGQGTPSVPPRWYYAYMPHGIAAGCTTSLLVLLYAHALGASVGQIGFIAAAIPLTSVPAFVFWGYISDRARRRKPFIVTLFIGMSISLMLMGLCSQVPTYFVANLLFGFLAAAAAPLGTTLVIETAKKADWPMRLAYFNRIGGFGYVAGLSLGALWLHISLFGLTQTDAMQALFVVGSMLALLAAALAWRWIDEPQVIESRPPSPSVFELNFLVLERVRYMPIRILQLIGHRRVPGAGRRFPKRFYGYLAYAFLIFAGFSAFYAIFPIYLASSLGFDASLIFVIYLGSKFTSVAFYARAGKSVRGSGARRTQMLAIAGRAMLFPSFLLVGVLGMGSYATFGAILALHALVGLCWAYINISGSTIVSSMATDDSRGEAIGTYNSVQGFGSIAGPITAGVVSQLLGFTAGFVLTAALLLCGLGLLRSLKTDD